MKIIDINSKSLEDLKRQFTNIITGPLEDVYADDHDKFVNEEVLGDNPTKIAKALVDTDDKIIGVVVSRKELSYKYKDILISKDGKALHLNTVMIVPGNEGKGYGKQLLDIVLGLAYEKEGNSITLTLQEKAEHTGFYERYGFKNIGYIDGLYEEGKKECIFSVEVSELAKLLNEYQKSKLPSTSMEVQDLESLNDKETKYVA